MGPKQFTFYGDYLQFYYINKLTGVRFNYILFFFIISRDRYKQANEI